MAARIREVRPAATVIRGIRPERQSAALDAREDRVEAAAVRLLRNEPSVGAVSLDAVAKAAGVTRLTLYNQFGSRRGLLEAVFDERAREGGLGRLADAMASADPREGLDRFIEIFCEFWCFEPALARLQAAGSTDPEFAEAIAARNERRREAIGVLVKRMESAQLVRPDSVRDLTDLLFALTSHAMFNMLRTAERNPEKVSVLIKTTCAQAIASAAPDALQRPARRSSRNR